MSISADGILLEAALAGLRAAGEATRLRLLLLLHHGEVNVTDLAEILGQSQPRISRHLKLLLEAGLIERQREGSWAFFRMAEEGAGAGLARAIVERLETGDPVLARDLERLAEVRAARAEEAAAYFRDHARNWDTIRALHVEEAAVELAIREAVGERPVRALLDLGTGTGRIIEVLGPQADRIVGLDQSLDMLAVARANLARQGLSRAQLRQGDVYALPVPPNSFDLVVVHQVLHFLEEPARCIREAARALAPGGRLLIVDFAPHQLEFLRDAHAHRRLGFPAEAVEQWMRQAGLEPELQRELPPHPTAQPAASIGVSAAPAADAAAGKLTVSLWLARDTRLVTDLPLPVPNRAVA